MCFDPSISLSISTRTSTGRTLPDLKAILCGRVEWRWPRVSPNDQGHVDTSGQGMTANSAPESHFTPANSQYSTRHSPRLVTASLISGTDWNFQQLQPSEARGGHGVTAVITITPTSVVSPAVTATSGTFASSKLFNDSSSR